MSLPAIAAVWAISLILALAGGWRLGIDHMKASAADIEAARVATREAAQQGAADAISKIEVRNVTVRQALQREIIEKPVFRDCRSGPAAVQLLNRAAGIEPVEPAGSGVMPAAAEPGG